MTSFGNAQNKKNRDGAFRPKRVYFSQVSNEALRDKNLSLKGKGLYALIQSYITIENFTLYKDTLKSVCKEGRDGFDSAWRELKKQGYLKQHKMKDEKGKIYYEYDLLDVAVKDDNEVNYPYTDFPYTDNPVYGKVGVYNNTINNNTVSMYVSMFEEILDVTDIGTLKKFIEDNKINEILDEELYKTLLIEVKNNKRVKRYDLYFIKTLKNIFNAGVRTISDYDKYLEDFKTKKEAEKKTKVAKSKTKTEAKAQAVKTRFHNINESFRNYSEDELVEVIKEPQKGKFGEDNPMHSLYTRAIKNGLNSLSIPMRKVIIEYAKSNNLDIPN